jgi:outer membrane cobalamin receptor
MVGAKLIESATSRSVRAQMGSDVSLADVARQCGLSRGYFAESFKVATGVSAHQWLQRFRIDKAKSLLKASLDARWQAVSKLSLDASLLYVSSWIDVNREFTFQQLTQPGFTTVNIAANYDIDDHFTLYGRVANLLDEHYQNPNGFLAPSLGWYLGIKVKE